MPVVTTPSFVCTIPLKTTPADRRTLRVRMEAARSAYNALLGECMRRLQLMRESCAWRSARSLPKGKEKTATYRALNEKFGFREYDLYPFIQQQRKGFIGQHLDAHTAMALAKRAFAVTERWAFRIGGRPRFRRFGDLRSVQGIGSHSAIAWRRGRCVWSGLNLEPIIDPSDAVIAHALKHRVRLVRIVRMVLRGREQYFVQLTLEGDAYRKPKHTLGSGIVGLDIGPSTIAVVSEKAATLQQFCGELESTERRIRQLQRQADRQQRANNPHCFDDKGRWKKGERVTVRTNRMRSVRGEASELMRRETEHRKNLHGRLAHQILSLGDDIRTEKLSYTSFQRMFGRSSRFRAPGMFVGRLRGSGKKLGALVTEFDPRKPMLSQTCPKCGTLRKKKLSERWHECACGCAGQRDIISALLATCVVGGKLDARQARKTWRRLCNVVHAASSQSNGPTCGASARALPRPIVGGGSSHANIRHNPVSAVDVVAGRKMQARATEKPGEDDAHARLVNVQHLQQRCSQKEREETPTGIGSRRVLPKLLHQQELWEDG